MPGTEEGSITIGERFGRLNGRIELSSTPGGARIEVAIPISAGG